MKNVCLGSCGKLTKGEAPEKARMLKMNRLIGILCYLKIEWQLCTRGVQTDVH